MSETEFVFSKPRVFKKQTGKTTPPKTSENKNSNEILTTSSNSLGTTKYSKRKTKLSEERNDDNSADESKENGENKNFCIVCTGTDQRHCSCCENVRSFSSFSNTSSFSSVTESNLDGNLYRDQIFFPNDSNDKHISEKNSTDEYPQLDNFNNYENSEYDDQILTEDLKDKVKLELEFPDLNKTKWQDAFLNRSLKYKKFINKRAVFFNKLHITPGIGLRYARKLEIVVPYFGSLIELYLTVDEKKFKDLLFKYATINSKSLNLIYLSCQKYYEKYGNKFSDFSF